MWTYHMPKERVNEKKRLLQKNGVDFHEIRCHSFVILHEESGFYLTFSFTSFKTKFNYRRNSKQKSFNCK